MPLRRRSISLALVSFALLAGVWAWRRAASPTLSEEAKRYAVPEVARQVRGGRPVFFVGLDGADWQLLDRYVAAGTMPELARLVREGTGGVLRSEQPPLSPLLWTTMMTGRGPLEHGILDFTRFAPGSGAREPITSTERRVSAVWNMLSQAGRSVAVLGMWATFPAEPVNGVIVSDRLFSFQHRGEAPRTGAVWPAEEDERARRALADSERSVGLEELRAYLPWLDDTEYAAAAASPDPYAHPVGALRRILIETRVYDALAEDLWHRREPDVLVLYVQGTDAIGHVFAPFAPPRQPGIDEADFNRYSGVPETYFRAIDRQLGRYRELAQERGAVLMLASDHGFLWSEGRPRELSSMAIATAGKWHREDGIFLLWGPGIPAAAGHAGRGGIAQVAATVLALAGLPSGKGLAGPPLGGVAAPSTEAVDFEVLPRAKPEEIAAGPGDAEELAKLRALGYLGGSESAAAMPGSASTRTGGSYNNEGLLLEATGRTREAIAAYERALALDSGLLTAAWNLSNLLFESGGDLERADRLAVEAYAAGLPSGGPLLVARARSYRDSGRLSRSVALLDGALAARADEELRLFRGRYRIESGDCAGAAADFAAVTAARPQDAVAHASLGMAKLCLGDTAGATRSLRRSLELDPDQPAVSAALSQLTQR